MTLRTSSSGQSGACADRLHVFEAGGEGCKKTIFDPWAPDCAEDVFLPYRFYLVEHAAGLVLVDCGAHPSLAIDPRLRLGGQAELSAVDMREGDDVVSKLAGVGVAPGEIAHIVLTHLHYDHCGGLELLPQVAVHVQRAELEFAEAPPVYQALSYIRADWEGVERWAPHGGTHDLFGDGSVVLLPTPGHTPGHQSVEVRLPAGRVLLVGDAAYRPREMASRTLPGYLWNPDALLASWDLLERRRDAGVELVLTHFPYREV